MSDRTTFVYYNSWDESYKKPFGAVRKGDEVTFRIKRLVSAVKDIYLVINIDGQSPIEFPLEHPTENEYFETTLELSKDNGLYFYTFRVVVQMENEESSFFYGNNEQGLGGVGTHYEHQHDVKTYQLTTYEIEDYAPQWFREGVIYHIFVDRFNNGNEDGRVSNPKPNSMIYTHDSNIPYYIKNEEKEIVRWDFCGGNLKGIIKKLPYLNDLGVTVLYLSPIFEARNNHKYDTGDFHTIDPMFGDEEVFKYLIKEARNYGIKIIMDGVFNHVGADSIYFNKEGTYDSLGAYQSVDSPYFDWFDFHEFPNDYESWWGVKDLPALSTELNEVKGFIYEDSNSVVKYWTQTGIGGWRLDVVDELSDEFIKGIRNAVDESSQLDEPVVIGEVWEDASNKIAYGKRRHYIEGNALHGVMNYPFRDIIIQFLKDEMNSERAVKTLLNLYENYPPAAFYSNMNIIGSHDTKRIKTELREDNELVKLAFVLMFILPGTPTIYYGDEVGLLGEEDPDNRRPFPWGHEDKVLQSFVQRIIQFRKDNHSLIDGSFLPFYTGKLLGIIREYSSDEWTLFVLNPTNETRKFDLSQIDEKTGRSVKDFIKKQSIKLEEIKRKSFKLLSSNDEDDI